MPIRFQSMDSRQSDTSRSIFLSASIPEPPRWDGHYDAREITDAVVALARESISRGYHLVTAAHPTIAPLLMYVAAEFPKASSSSATVRVYQSLLFEDYLPTATRRFEAEGVGEITWTRAVEGEMPRPGHWNQSLATMRETMLAETSPSAAVFIGGMEGVLDEEEIFSRMYPRRPTYAAKQPGGAAERLASRSTEAVRRALRDSRAYPALWTTVLDDLEREPAPTQGAS